jgi:DNA gyrase subunit A
MGRATQGVRLINLKDEDSIAAVTQVPREEDEEVDSEMNGVVEETVE